MPEMKKRRIIDCTDELEAKSDGKYAVDKRGMDKFTHVYKFFCGLAEEDGGDVECFDMESDPTSAGVSVEVSMVDLYRDSMAQFVETLQYIDVFDVRATESGTLLISAIVSHVWEVVQ